MTHEVEFLAPALDDLQAIADWLVESADPATATIYIGRIQERCAALAAFPHRGTPRDELGAGTRSLAFERRVTLFYRVAGAKVQVIRIVAAGRLWPGLS